MEQTTEPWATGGSMIGPGGQAQREVITSDAIESEYGEHAERAQQFSSSLLSELALCGDGGPIRCRMSRGGKD